MIVYIVTRGSYSDYGIDSVFSTKELAQAYIATYPDHDRVDIEEYEVDDNIPHIREGMKNYNVNMVLAAGQMASILMNSRPQPYNVGIYRPWFYCHGIFAEDENHAIKICNEKRAQYISEVLMGIIE